MYEVRSDATLVLTFDVQWTSLTEDNDEYRVLSLDVTPMREPLPATHVGNPAGWFEPSPWPAAESRTMTPIGISLREEYRAEMPVTAGETVDLTIEAGYTCEAGGQAGSDDLTAEILLAHITER